MIKFKTVVLCLKLITCLIVQRSFGKTLMYEFWYDYINPKYQQNAKLCYMDTDNFIIHIKTEDVDENIADDIKKRFNTSNYKVNRPLPTGRNKKVIGLMKDE